MKYFTIKELCDSATAKKYGIDNTPDDATRGNMITFIEQVLDPVREKWRGPISVSSGYRCEALNSHPEIRGAKSSHHLLGTAADIFVGSTINMTRETATRNLFLMIANSMPDLPFCQLIYEVNPKTGVKWVHISFEPSRPLVNGRGDSLDARRQIIDGLVKK